MNIKKEIIEGKKLLFFPILNWSKMFKVIIQLVHLTIIGISEMNYSKVVRDGREKLNILFYKLPILEWSNLVLFEVGFGLVKIYIL